MLRKTFNMRRESLARILVIDDDDQMRDLLQAILEREGYEVIIAEDGKIGTRLFQQNLPDLVLTDLLMPEKEGIETIMDLKREYPETKIIAISGGGNHVGPDNYLKLARKIGANYALKKPFERKELLETIDVVLSETRDNTYYKKS